MNSSKMVVGSEEWCSFPSLGVPAIKARVDSGAKTSSIHAFNIQTFRRDGDLWVSFEIHPIQHNRRVVIRCELPVIDRRAVKSSSGDSDKRYVVKAPMKIGEQSWDVELTLANRDSMGYRMLLGREAMGGRVLVDPAASFCLGELSRQALDELYGHDDNQPRGLKIGLLADNAELYSNRRLMEAGVERGHEMLFVDIKQCSIKLDALHPEIHYRGGRILNDLDAVIPRIRPSMTFFGAALTRHFESLGVYALNGAAAITQTRDKLFALQLLLDKGVPIPTTGFASSALDTAELVEMVGGAPLIVKLLEGSHGQGVVLAETRKAAESVINAFKSVNANLLVQECVKEAQGKNLRCFVADGKVAAAIEREIAPEEHGADQREAAAKVKLSLDEKKLAHKAAHALGLKVAGVDMIRSAKGPLLLSVVASPGLEEVESASGKDIAGLMITAIEKKLGWKRALANAADEV